MKQLWTEKHSPKTAQEFVGNSEAVSQCIEWAKKWQSGKEEKPLLLYGQTGVGKTCLAYILAKEFDWQVFELNSSHFRDKETVEKVVTGAALNATLFAAKRLVLLDEIDGLQAQDRGGAAAILKIIRETKNPVILTANDIYADQKLSGIREYCTKIEFRKINYLSIAKRLKEILAQEKVSFEEDAVKEIAKKCQGDFRAALLDLQTLSLNVSISTKDVETLGERERTEKIFAVMSKIFHGKSTQEIRDTMFYSDQNNDMVLRWVEENIPLQYTGSDVTTAFDFLSRADRFNGRIRNRQYYGFLKYSSDLMSLGINSSKTKEYHSFTPFRFPSLLSKLSRSAPAREMKKRICQKIGKKTHSSAKEVMVHDLAFLKQLLEDKNFAAGFIAEVGLEPEEAAFLLEEKAESKKVKEIMEQAEKIKQEKIHAKNKPVALTLEREVELEEKTALVQKHEKESGQTRLF